jgi:phosphate transport system protein
MLRGQYFSNSYSVQITNLVRLILRMKLYTSKILREMGLILNSYSVETRAKIFEIIEKLRILSVELEDSVNKIIALSHPVAFDLRFLLSSIKISAELNYISNWAKKTIESIQKLEDQILLNENKKDLTKMLDISFETLKDVISTLLQFDSKKKADKEILTKIDRMLKADDAVDEIYEKILQDGIKAIKSKNADPIMVFEAIGIAKNLEKISDCIHNMIVTTKYILTGKRA